MKEFMLLIRNEKNSKEGFSAEKQQEFVTERMVYIGKLMDEKKLLSAQPLIREGKLISNPGGTWKDVPFNESKEVIVGYYHILAKDMDEAIEIAKGNPEFANTPNARIEVRPIKTREESISYDYPNINK